jgi:uncharacterized repeat protein (TIGR01451 family)
LPANVSLVPNSANAQINGVDVTGFVVTPTVLSGGEVAWGQKNGDFTLDIPAGQTLVLTYQVTVEAVTGVNINNSVFVDWTSLDSGSLAERTGAGCPTTDTLNDYCYGPATVSVATLDNTFIAKSAVGDSYAETPPSATDPIVRVGDTVTYDLTLSLQEYTTRNVVVEDDLPAGLALESFTIIGGANFSYTLGTQPAAGDTGTLRWEFGDITRRRSGRLSQPVDGDGDDRCPSAANEGDQQSGSGHRARRHRNGGRPVPGQPFHRCHDLPAIVLQRRSGAGIRRGDHRPTGLGA